MAQREKISSPTMIKQIREGVLIHLVISKKGSLAAAASFFGLAFTGMVTLFLPLPLILALTSPFQQKWLPTLCSSSWQVCSCPFSATMSRRVEQMISSSLQTLSWLVLGSKLK